MGDGISRNDSVMLIDWKYEELLAILRIFQVSPKLREMQEELKTEIKLHRLFSAEILDKLLDNSQRQ